MSDCFDTMAPAVDITVPAADTTDSAAADANQLHDEDGKS